MKRSISILLLVLAASGTLQAEVQDADQPVVNPEDIAAEMEEPQTRAGEKFLPLLDFWADSREKFQKKTGLDWRVTYDSLTLGSFLGDGVPVGASGDLTFQGLWAIAHRWRENPTELRFRFRHRHAYGGTAPSDIGPEIGALWGVVRGFSDSGLEIPDFYFRHVFEEPNLEIRYGQMRIDSQFGGHQLASGKKYFLNRAFSANPAVAFPRFGAGITALLHLDKGLSIGLGSTTVQGTQEGTQVDFDLASGALFHALQFAYDYKGSNDLSRRLQLLAWHSDAVQEAESPEGQGLSLTYERKLSSDGARLFARAAWSDGGAASVDQLLSAGIGFPCGEHDFAGLGTGIGRGSDRDHDVQAVFEGFYRWHPKKNLWITPDVQLLMGEGFDDGPGIRFIAGLRAGIRF
jgi:porin